MPIDLSNFTSDMGSMSGMAYQANVVTGGVLFNGGMIVFFLIILFALLKNEQPFEVAITVAGWSMFVVSLFVLLAHLINGEVTIFFFVCAILGTLYIYSRK